MRFAIGATAALAAAYVRAEDASSPDTESSPSPAVAKPTFTVCSNLGDMREAFANSPAAHIAQGPLPRAVHGRLGISMEPLKRKEGGE